MEGLNRLAMHELNGRQIKNIVRTAHALAVSEDTNLGLTNVHMALNGMTLLEADFAEARSKCRTEHDSHTAEHHAPRRRRVYGI